MQINMTSFKGHWNLLHIHAIYVIECDALIASVPCTSAKDLCKLTCHHFKASGRIHQIHALCLSPVQEGGKKHMPSFQGQCKILHIHAIYLKVQRTCANSHAIISRTLEATPYPCNLSQRVHSGGKKHSPYSVTLNLYQVVPVFLILHTYQSITNFLNSYRAPRLQ